MLLLEDMPTFRVHALASIKRKLPQWYRTWLNYSPASISAHGGRTMTVALNRLATLLPVAGDEADRYTVEGQELRTHFPAP
jgi:hypothetical protein